MTERSPRGGARAHHQSQRHRKRMLAVRAMVGETAWLDGQTRWSGGRVVWAADRDVVAPTAADLARAQRRLTQVQGYRRAAVRVLGDLHAWAAARQARLDLAKRLVALGMPDLERLASEARQSNPPALARLADLLVAEAVCATPILPAPSRALLAAGLPALPSLIRLIDDETAPLTARALAALVLGAIRQRAAGDDSQLFEGQHRDGPTGRAATWGLRRGLPADPPVISRLLLEADGTALAQRLLAATSGTWTFQLPPQLVRDLLARGVSPQDVVSVAEAAVAAEPFARRIRDIRHELPPPWKSRTRRTTAQRLRRQRQQLLAALVDLIHAYVGTTPQAKIFALVVRYGDGMLNRFPLVERLSTAMLEALRAGLALPPDLQRSFLALLATQHDLIWPSVSVSPGRGQQLDAWLRIIHQSEIESIVQLLRATGDAALARDALAQRLLWEAAAVAWRDAALCRWWLDLQPILGVPDTYSWYRGQIAHAINEFASLRAARGAWQPFVDALGRVPDDRRRALWEQLLLELDRTGLPLRATLPRLTSFVPEVDRYLGQTRRNADACWAPLLALLELEQAAPQTAQLWCRALYGQLLALEHSAPEGPIHEEVVSVAALLAITLADGDEATFQGIFRAAVQHRYAPPRELLEQAIPHMARFPGIRAAVAALFHQQPLRCVELIARIGLAQRLGSPAAAVLTRLDDDLDAAAATADLPSAWEDVLAVLPDLRPMAARYLQAQRLLHRTPDVPAGVRDALAQPRTLAQEAAFLERASRRQPERADLATRLANLRTYLADATQLLTASAREARERLAQITAEARLAAVAALVQTCFRDRLAAIVGPLPKDLVLDADLLNATLLTENNPPQAAGFQSQR